ncbi:hypothetical protein KOI40_18160 [Aestuariicella sp. G3-2]|uniref:hypothetical protein n=1 Tax=Pseudomaricurvus albidus TaxID=2842452 RepID=UPI001C0D3992|nr:hypothetical protein [Aestuariicella albida]MBU3071755.1 hypothetical protein [Aestuariicella albida]
MSAISDLRLFPSQSLTGQRRFVEPDFPHAHQELKRKYVIKHLLWQEYSQQYPDDAYSYAHSAIATSSD